MADLADIDDQRGRMATAQYDGVDQIVVEDGGRIGQQIGGTQREQPGIARPGADKIHRTSTRTTPSRRDGHVTAAACKKGAGSNPRVLRGLATKMKDRQAAIHIPVGAGGRDYFIPKAYNTAVVRT